MPNPRNLNYVLGSIGQSLQLLSTEWGEYVPPLQCLVINRNTGLPGAGVGWFITNLEGFGKLSRRQQRERVNLELTKLFAYPKWLKVLTALGLRAAVAPGKSPAPPNPALYEEPHITEFWSEVDNSKKNGCWPWNGPKRSLRPSKGHPNGRHFGLFITKNHGYAMVQRYVYITKHKSDLDIKVTALCGDETCCNPAHIIEKSGADATTEYGDIQKSFDLFDQMEQWEQLNEKRLVLTRREQSFLRQHLISQNLMHSCAICGGDFPQSLLVTAHIKPRAECSDIEKRDLNNVIPMCSLGCDALFELGWVYVEDGKVRVRQRYQSYERLNGLLTQLDGRPTTAWRAGRIVYFKWHARRGARKSSYTGP